MKFTTCYVNYALAAAMIIGNIHTANAECEVYFWQYEDVSTTYKAEAYDHNDLVCDDDRDSKDLHYGEFVGVKANKDHDNSIQTQIVKQKQSADDSNYQACDGYNEQGLCLTSNNGQDVGVFSKASCDSGKTHYILFPSNSTICMAATVSDAVVYDDNDRPIGICNDCKTISVENSGRRLVEEDESVLPFLRGGMKNTN